MRKLILALALLVCLGGAASAEPTCTFPWAADHDYFGQFEVGAFYLSPYNEVIEILGQVNGKLYVRNVEGIYCRTKPRFDLVYVKDGELLTADCTIPVKTTIQTFGKLPAGCYSPSTVVSIVEGKLTISTRTGTQ